MRIAIFALVVALFGAPPVSAQANDCSRAQRIVSRGGKAADEDWAFAYIVQCGTGGATALVDAMTRLRTSTDTAGLTRAYRPTWWFKDGAVFDKAELLARDPGASVGARVNSIITVITIVGDRMWIPYRRAVQTPENTICQVDIGAEAFDRPGSPLPTDFLQRAVQIRTDLLATPSVPLDVKRAANCIARATAREH